MKICKTAGCPTRIPDNAYKNRCAPCNRETSRARGTTAERGYDWAHEQKRAAIQSRIDAGETVRCWRCEVQLLKRAWALDHNDTRDGYRGPACQPCNLELAGLASHAKAGWTVTNLDLSDLRSRPSDGSHLTTDKARAIERYVARILKRLDLGYWRVRVARDLPPEGALMMIEPTDGRRFALLHVAADWWDEQDADEKRTDLTHECLHLAHHDQEEVIRRFKNTNGDVGEYPMSLVWDQFRLETERMVDSLSYVLAPLMPRWKAG